jgi:hypothetical protein
MPPQDPPSGYDTPDLGNKPSPGQLVPPGYDTPELGGPAKMPSQDPPSGYDMPDLSGAPAADQPAQGGPAAQSVQQGRFQMKPLGEIYQQGEKNNAAQTVKMDGRNIEVHEKDWLRQQTDASRAAKGQAPVTDQMWKDNVATTQYMNDAQREEHQMHFTAGTDGTGAQNAKLGGESLEEGRKHIFVMDGEGQVFAKGAQSALNERDDTGRSVHTHHSSFLAGEDVAGAGEMSVNRQGFVTEITDRSGHYKPGEQQTTQTLDELENKGVNLDNVKFTMDRGEDKTKGMANEYRQGGEQVFKARHNVADEIKERGQSVREKLDSDASRRATRVRKAGEHLDNGAAPADVSEAVQAHAAKDAAKLKGEIKAELKDQLQEQAADNKQSNNVRKALGKDKDKAPAQGQGQAQNQGTGGAGKRSAGR